MKKHNVRTLLAMKFASPAKKISMLTCYDYQTAQVLNQTDLDLILVGDSLGNVMLGFDTTVQVELTHMQIFAQAVRRGAPDKFMVVDVPFSAMAGFDQTLENISTLYRSTQAEAVKIEGAHEIQLKLIERLTQYGVAVMGHIGLQPQSVNAQGGYFTHGKDLDRANALIEEAVQIQKHGAFAIVLECVDANLAAQITKKLNIPVIGIGAGAEVDGQVLVINDLLKMGAHTPPKFCTPIADFFTTKKTLLNQYIHQVKNEVYHA
jgi:3-methyl-2-oxobutanoate hydroxymethyltransferase